MDVSPFVWAVRVRAELGQPLKVHTRNLSFQSGKAISFGPTDELPSSLEYFLGALATELVELFTRQALRNGLVIDNIECALSCALKDDLVAAGVVGESGDPSIAKIEGTIYISSDSPEATLQDCWHASFARAPIAQTLAKALPFSIRLCISA